MIGWDEPKWIVVIYYSYIYIYYIVLYSSDSCSRFMSFVLFQSELVATLKTHSGDPFSEADRMAMAQLDTSTNSALLMGVHY